MSAPNGWSIRRATAQTAWLNAGADVPDAPDARSESAGDGARAAHWTAWLARAHPAQRPPPGPWSTWLFLGGRGAGKTRAGAEWLQAQAAPGARLAMLGPTLHEVRAVMIEGASGLRAIAADAAARPRWESSRRRLVWDNGAEAQAFSAEDPDGLRGPQFHAAWADEFCAWRLGEAALANLRLGLRLGDDPRLVVTTTPRPTGALRRLRAEPGLVETRAPTAANAAHLAPAFLSGLHAIYGGTRLAAQELEGQVVEAAGGLWTAAGLAACRGDRPTAPLERVVVAVDPPAGAAAGGGGSGSGPARGSACGIVVAGRSGERAYVLADASVIGFSPQGWAQRVAATVAAWGAAGVTAEANQGGDMVRAVLTAAGVNAPVRLVHARLSKHARAQPVAALYEQGRITHCAAFPELEEQLMALGGGEESRGGGPGLDRADALVWALTTLMLEERGDPRVRVV